MCGIAGFLVPPSGDFDLARHDTNLMCDALAHRGPDGAGYWGQSSEGVGLYHRLLSIIGSKAEGHQPMHSDDGRYHIAFNGEIYNYIEIANELGAPSGSLMRRSDTAALVNAFSRWGIAGTLRRCLGMFALAVWDQVERRLYLGCDPAGKKPLYFGKQRGHFHFASEIAAFRKVPKFELTVSAQQISNYLSFGFVPTPGSVFREVDMLGGGEILVVDESLQVSRITSHKINPKASREISFNEAVGEAESLLDDAVRLRLRADVPLGCYLSGGIDSGLIVASAARCTDMPLRTFTISVKGSSLDERHLAAETARRYKTDHEVIEITTDIASKLPRILKAYGQPFADPSAVPAYEVAAAARRHLTVVLTGDGADEIFGGYRRQSAYLWAAILGRVSAVIPARLFDSVLSILPIPATYRSRYAFLHRFIRGLRLPAAQQYFEYCMDGFTEDEKAVLFPALGRENPYADYLSARIASFEDLGRIDRLRLWDYLVTLHDDMLIKADIASMSHSIEARCPFLDRRIVDWSFSIKPELALGWYQTKPILRALANRRLPSAVAQAPKRGFEIPIFRWLNEDLRDLSRDVILAPNSYVCTLGARRAIEAFLDSPQKLDPDRWSRRVWTLLALELWHREGA